MHRHAVIALVGDAVRIVFSDDQIAFGAQQSREHARQCRAAVIQQGNFHLPPDAFENRGETMHRDIDRALALLAPCLDQSSNGGVIGIKNCRTALGFSSIIQTCIARNWRDLGNLRKGAWHIGPPVAVDHQAGIGLQDRRCVQRLGQVPGDAVNTDIPANMAAALRFTNAKIAEGTGNRETRMIGGEQERAWRNLAQHLVGRGFIGIEHDHSIHGAKAGANADGFKSAFQTPTRPAVV